MLAPVSFAKMATSFASAAALERAINSAAFVVATIAGPAKFFFSAHCLTLHHWVQNVFLAL
jgi:hypothetical protein